MILPRIQSDFEKRKKYFFSLYPVIFLPFAFYFFRLNFIYNDYRFNLFFYFIFIILLLVVPCLYKFTQRIFLALWIFYTCIIFAATFLIFLAGGNSAPGVFWISLIPLIGVAILGDSGVFIGMGYTILTVIIFHLFPTPNHLIPKELFHPYYYQSERTLNLNIFILFTLVFTYLYYKLEKKNNDEIIAQKNKNENLLKVLFHDIANPALNIQLQAFKLLKQNTTESITGLNSILTSSKHINQILESVRSLKAFKDGKSVILFEWFSINESVDSALESINDRLSDKHITVDLNLDKTPFKVYGNQALFTHQVLINILINSIKFSTEHTNISISTKFQNNTCYLKIIDQGIGIPPEILKNLFSDNHQTSRRGLKGEVGTGYGMSLVQFFIENFSGKLEISSKDISLFPENSGTEINISLKAKSN